MKSAALRRFYEATGFTVMRAAVLINIAALLGIIGLIVVNAWPAMTWEFLTEPPRDLMTKGGILPCIIGTFCLALAVLSLPIIINTTEAALSQIPQDWREASLALGASQRETTLKVVLPNALPGILTGSILALARAAGETAAIMYTGSVFFTPKEGVSLFDPVMALPYHIYVLATSGTSIEATRPLQYGTALVLLILVLLMSSAAIVIRERRRR
ncbi:MAG: phosphate ABC transporter, permease protein PstA [Sutterella sp. 54_7]|nr:MAG: phosphate ABC transporter, permease protein PstA [Sutterella sp. 54_7]